MNTRVVPPRGFGGAAGFCVFQLWVQEGTESFWNVCDVTDTSRTRVQVVKPLVGDPNVTQVLNPGDLLPRTL